MNPSIIASDKSTFTIADWDEISSGPVAPHPACELNENILPQEVNHQAAPDAPYPSSAMMNPSQIISLLGVNAVLLPLAHGEKGPFAKNWQKTTYKASLRSGHQTLLAKSSAIGVLLGEASQGLCSIDFDSDDALNQFLAANPHLEVSLRTKAKRGANIWVIIEGSFPPSHKLTSEGKPIGEWRANGNQTVITGKHPDGMDYTRIVDAPPLRLNYEQIIWPWEECAEGYRSKELVVPINYSDHSNHSDVSANATKGRGEEGVWGSTVENGRLEIRSEPASEPMNHSNRTKDSTSYTYSSSRNGLPLLRAKEILTWWIW